jgi:hypothetical protein
MSRFPSRDGSLQSPRPRGPSFNRIGLSRDLERPPPCSTRTLAASVRLPSPAGRLIARPWQTSNEVGHNSLLVQEPPSLSMHAALAIIIARIVRAMRTSLIDQAPREPVMGGLGAHLCHPLDGPSKGGPGDLSRRARTQTLGDRGPGEAEGICDDQFTRHTVPRLVPGSIAERTGSVATFEDPRKMRNHGYQGQAPAWHRKSVPQGRRRCNRGQAVRVCPLDARGGLHSIRFTLQCRRRRAPPC